MIYDIIVELFLIKSIVNWYIHRSVTNIFRTITVNLIYFNHLINIKQFLRFLVIAATYRNPEDNFSE